MTPGHGAERDARNPPRHASASLLPRNAQNSIGIPLLGYIPRKRYLDSLGIWPGHRRRRQNRPVESTSHGEQMLNSGSEFDVEFRAVTKRFGAVTAVEETDFHAAARRLRRVARPVRLRQDHLPQDDRRLRAAERRAACLIGGEDMTGVPPYRRPVNMVFQHYALFPHFDVETNIAYGLQPDPAQARRYRDHAPRRRGAGDGASRTLRQAPHP